MQKQIKIQSDIKYFNEIEHFINVIQRENSIPRKLFCKIYLSVTEAVNNAILHGNKNDSSKNIQLEYSESDRYIKFIICDEGKGFDLNKVPDPTLIDNIAKESGRGIFIMKKYCDEINYYNNGSTVELIYFKESD